MKERSSPPPGGRKARIVRFKRHGSPLELQLRAEEIAPPPAGEVQVNIRAIGLNQAEALFRQGLYFEEANFPARLGYEATGYVAALGEGVTGFSVGDAVSLIPLPSLTRWGTWGEMVNLPADYLVAHDSSIPAEKLAATWMATATAYGALIDLVGMKEGDIVLISAASSSVGLTAIQLARAVGARPIALTRTSAKRSALFAAGAESVIATDEEDVGERVSAISADAGADIAFDPVGGPLLGALASSMRRGGTIILYGRLDPRRTDLPVSEIIGRALQIRGFVFSDFVSTAENRERLKTFVLDGLASGALDPIIDSSFPLDQVIAASERLESGDQFGKIIITIEA